MIKTDTLQWRIQDFPENCMKLKDFGPGARPCRPPPDPPMLCVGYTVGTDCNATVNACDVIVSTAVKLEQISPIFVIESAKYYHR